MKQKFTKLNKFAILKKIAHGGMAEIFLALDCGGSKKLARRFVALKKILSTHITNTEFAKMFQNEVQIVANLNHSNMASIYEFGIDKDQYFICMEYISGRNVRQLLKKLSSKKANVSIPNIAYIIKNVCLGLDYAHNYTDKLTGKVLNIIHRDISPQNIMISFNGEIKVIDFGIAKATNSEATKAGVLKGKFEYMSPEQVRGKSLNNQTDIFSLGAILWEMLAGKKLFTASEELAVLRKIKECRVPDLKKLNPQIPDTIIEITNKALQPNKSIRYKTAGEMVHDISVFLNKKYPNFTPTHFIKFIKETYIEEMDAERKYLRQCAEDLASLDTTHITNTQKTEGTSTILAPPPSSARYDEDEMEKSQFKGAEDLEGSAAASYYESRVTLKEGSYTESESIPTLRDTKYNKSTDITKNKFNDALPQKAHTSKSLNNQSVLSIKNNTPSTDNPLYKDHHIQSYNPYRVTNTTASNLAYRMAMLKRKKRRRRNNIIFVSTVLLTLSGSGYYFKQPLLKIVKEYELQSFFQPTPKRRTYQAQNKKRAINSTSSHKHKKSIHPSKEVYLETIPSGANIKINNKLIKNITPTAISIPHNGTVKAVIEKKGYYPLTKVIKFQSIKNNQHKITLQLQAKPPERIDYETL